MTTATTTRTANKPKTPADKARLLFKMGYALSESRYARNLFILHKPDGTRCTVDLMRGTCSCPETGCFHKIWVAACLRWIARKDRKPMRRRLFTRKHIQRWGGCPPVCTAPPEVLRSLVDDALCARVKYFCAGPWAATLDLQLHYLAALTALHKHVGYEFSQVQNAIENRRGPVACVLRVADEIEPLEARVAA